MSDRLPIFIEPLNYAERRRELEGELCLCDFPRLTDLPGFNGLGNASINLSFRKLGRFPVVDGEFSTILDLQCQSCMQLIPITVSSKLKLGFVASISEADLLPDAYEPFLLESEKTALIDVIEEELLLTIPYFPKHAYDCIDKSYQSENKDQLDRQSEIENPFSVLAKLKKTGD